ncbi:hypothetical protein Dsin_003470 [Dipteronia sinensis]|uniref:Transcription repressor n=1 Tax=Dipteronia sinensis TaxID=43782 RepID=A0AAE0B9K2_9ROSI|nr:hypothetical protein Dsin_003470 [Dipteronia sinensis]
MAKRLKLKLSRVIPSLQFCRSKRSTSVFVETPLPAIFWLSPINPKAFDIGYPNLPAPPPSTPENCFIKTNLSSSNKVVSVGCSTCRSGSCKQNKKEAARWYHDDSLANWAKQNTKTPRNRVVSVSSRDSARDCFSSGEEEGEDEDEETETLLSSSRSFSDDSSFEFDRSMEDKFFNSENRGNNKKKKLVNTNIKKIRRLRRYASKNKESEVRMMIPCTVEGKVRESVAVVKKSVDPYDDFKQSMWEMILEKKMFEAKDLEQLLQCFLSLNSRHYHAIIVEAFSQIWEVLFSDFPVKDARVRSAGQFQA